MNLKDFLNHKDNCPICGKQLKLMFHSDRRQKINYIDDRVAITFSMGSPLSKNEKVYDIIFFIDPISGSFFIDFFSVNGKKFENVPIPLIRKFLTFNKNLGAYAFYKYCADECYTYSSDYFDLDLKKSKIPDLTIQKEFFVLSREILDGYRTFKLVNNYHSNKSILSIHKMIKDLSVTNDNVVEYYDEFKSEVLITNLIKFISKEDTIERLNKLLVFS
jgi:hypothetical protein